MGEPDTIEPLRIDAELWSHRTLLERIVGRWFNIIEEMPDVEIGWQVNLVANQDNVDGALSALNEHLRDLSWLAVLQEGSPYDLVILPEPPQGEGLSNSQISVVWAVFTFFLALAGTAWLQLQDPNLKLTDSNLMIEAFCWFALPIVLVMFVSSELRRRIALRSGVSLGHHIPLAVPFLMTPAAPIWPFGIIGFTSQRRMDLIAFRDRKSLAFVSLIAPLTMICSGTALTILGYWLTSNISPQFETAPPLVEPSILSELVLSLLLTSEEVGLRSVWLHPLGLAGLALGTMGWILLLPLPGFPGDRLLSALLEPGEMEEGTTQTWLFVGVLATGIYVILNGGFWPWLVLVGIGTWRRFSPETSTPPFVLNESIGFDKSTKNRIGITMVAMLLLGFPGLMPVGELQDWDAGLDTSNWPTEISFAPGGVGAVEFPLKTQGVMSINVEFQVSFTGLEVMSEWRGCGQPDPDNIGNCAFEGIGPSLGQIYEIEYEAHTLMLASSPFIMTLHWGENLESRSHSVLFSPSTRPAVAAPQWTWDGDRDEPQYCTEILLDEIQSGNLTIESPLFSFDGDDVLPLATGTNDTVCIDGVFGAGRTVNGLHGGLTRMIAPNLVATMDDGTIIKWRLDIENQYPLVFEGSYPASSPFLQASYLVHQDEGDDPHCPFDMNQSLANANWQDTDDNGTWVWNLSQIPQGAYDPDAVHSMNGTLIFPGEGTLLQCINGQTMQVMELRPGPTPLGVWHGRDVDSSWPIRNYGDEPVDIEVQRATFGVQTNLNLSSFILQPGEVWQTGINIFGENNTIQNILWFEPSTDYWILHAVTHCISPDGCDE